mmetsp:Transcript_7781/g.25874  ORF Transcript_7781/g.25874 Transcript_7781/m.25874 type:complete len:210 (+) Transcript_7781:1206-1835(+)
MCDVSIAMNSERGFFRPPFSGTFTIDPSTIFKSACCTPSPDTSRVMLTFVALLPSLSISSTYTIPVCAFLTSKLLATSSLCRTDSTSSPTYPACVNVVASATAKGTSTRSARVFASNVFPTPVGPHSKTFDFSKRTFSSNEWHVGNAPLVGWNGETRKVFLFFFLLSRDAIFDAYFSSYEVSPRPVAGSPSSRTFSQGFVPGYSAVLVR